MRFRCLLVQTGRKGIDVAYLDGEGGGADEHGGARGLAEGAAHAHACACQYNACVYRIQNASVPYSTQTVCRLVHDTVCISTPHRVPHTLAPYSKRGHVTRRDPNPCQRRHPRCRPLKSTASARSVPGCASRARRSIAGDRPLSAMQAGL
eukprot:136589-Rhodomonas_salina.2